MNKVQQAATAELETYHGRPFELGALPAPLRLPLPDEPFVPFWEEVERESRQRGAFTVLRERLPQLAFPIREGMSQCEPYHAATLRGLPVAAIPEATGLELAHPEALEVALFASPAGRIPLLVVRRREEFAQLLRALAKKNEPVPVPEAQGALMVAGFNNWGRIAELKRQVGAEGWGEAWKRLSPQKELYQDRFILLSDGPYSAVPAAELGLSDEEWRRISLTIRRDHECAHYLTRRVFGAMRNHLLDELAADYAGLLGATGHFRADWFLRFLGLENLPEIRPGGRIELYRGKPPLSDAAFRLLGEQVRAAAQELERFDAARAGRERNAEETAQVVAALATFRLDELAREGAGERLGQVIAALA